MKKLSILLAAAMSFNMLATTAVVTAAEETSDINTLISCDFNTGEGTTLPEGLSQKTSYTCGGYVNVDAAHDKSMKFAANNGFRYEFPADAGNIVTVSFEVMKPKNADARFHVINDSDGTKNGNGQSMFTLAETYADFEWWSSRKRVEFMPGRWYQVDLVIENAAEGNTSTVNEYIDGWLANTETDLGTMSAVSFVSTNANEVYVDNFTVRKGEYVTECTSLDKTFDFEYGENTSAVDKTGNGTYATLPGGFTRVGTLDASSYLKYVSLDAEHGTSLSSVNSSGAYYDIPVSAQNQPVKLSFELRVADTSDNGNFYVKSGINTDNNNWWQNDALIIVKNGNLYFANASNVVAITKDEWVKVDLIMTPNGTQSTVDCYVNGNKVNTASVSRDSLTKLAFWSKGRSSATYIDNVKLQTPFEAGTFTVLPTKELFVPEVDNNMLAVEFDSSVDKSTFDDTAMTITTADETPVEIDYTEWNDYATELKIYLTSDLNYASSYNITLPEGLKSVYGDALTDNVVMISTTDKLADFVDFNDGEMPARITVPGTAGNAASVADGVMTLIAGESTDWCQAFYNMPYEVTDGVIKVSFDHYVEGVESGKTYTFLKFTGTHTLGAGLTWLEDADGVSITPAINWASTELSDWKNKTWHHYDLIFDLDNKTFNLYMDGKQGTVAGGKYAEKITQLTFGTTGTTKTLIDNLSVKYYDNLGEFETDLTNEVDSSKKTINIIFKDAVNAATLTEGIGLLGNDFIDIGVDSTSLYNATVTINDKLIDGQEYTLDLSGVKTIFGADYKNPTIKFTAVDKFAVTGAKVLDGTTAVTRASDWDNTKAYTLSADVENSAADEKTIHAIVAGYSNNKLKNIVIVPLTIKESGTYTAALTATDMKGATEIKIFAFNSLTDLVPILTPPVELN